MRDGLAPLAVALAVAWASSGCHRSGGSVAVWIWDDLPRSSTWGQDSPDAANIEWTSNRVKLAGAINETLSFHFAVRAKERAVERPDFRVAPLVSVGSRIDPSVVSLYRMLPVEIGDLPGWHIRLIPPDERDLKPLDLLVPIRAPRGGLPAALLPGETYHFWADLTVPKRTFEGTYNTRIELLARGKAVGGVSVQLTVWPFVLPDDVEPQIIVRLDHRELFRHHVRYRNRPHAFDIDDWREDPARSELDALLSATLRMLRSHRLTPVLHELTAPIKVNAAGEITIDWGQYDAVVEPCLSGRLFFNRAPLQLWPLPVPEVLWKGVADFAAVSPPKPELLRRYLAQCAEHFAQKGWLKRSYAVPPAAASFGVESVAATRGFADLARSADERIAILSELFPQDMAPYAWVDYPHAEFDDCVDIWMPPGQFYDAETMAAERGAGKRTWIAVDRPPFTGSVAVFAPSTYTRVLTWQARQLGAEALSLGCVNRWPDAESDPAPEDCIGADPNVLLYPGRPFGLSEPVPSVRLKWVRRSLQDAAYCTLLESHGLEYVTATLRRSLAPYSGSEAYRTHFADGRAIGWVDEPAIFEAARHIMAEHLVSESYAKPGRGQGDALAHSVKWRRFMDQARGVRIQVDGIRIRSTGTPATPAAEVECALTIVNGERAPVSGTVRFAELPKGWVDSTDGVAVPPIAPNGSCRVTLVAQAGAIPTDTSGHLALPLEFVTDAGKVYRFVARLSYVTAETVPHAIEIDGDLSDWPLGSVNVAADFVLITPGPPRPHNRTLGFVMRDHEYLYVAINCETDPPRSRDVEGAPARRTPTSWRKTVVYDDMIPVGDELIELLIDPLNTGTRSPSDLYHVLLKRSGSDLTEKGIRFDPPCGTCEPWAVDLRVATRVTAERWTAELAIPLAAFGGRGVGHTTWGFSITRYNTIRQEFSTWSGAVRNAYDPLSLGNIYLP